MFIWLRVRLCLVFAVAVSEAKISSSILVFVSPSVFGFPYRFLLKWSLTLALSVVSPHYYTGGLLMQC